MRARNIASDFVPTYFGTCDKKLKYIRERVENSIRIRLRKSIESIDNMLVDNNFKDIEDIEKEFFSHLKSYDWLNVSTFFHDFQELMISHWDALFPKLVNQADSYYDAGQYVLARELFETYKNLVKKFTFTTEKSHLIMAFKHYEMLCHVQLITGEMYQEVSHATDLINANKFQEAISFLNEINNLENEIPTNYRNKRQLHSLHSSINQLRRDIYD